MKRRQLFELEDLRWWPRLFRDAVTDYLVTAQRTTRIYEGFAARLAQAIKRCGATQVIDLCSGAGGPWIDLLPALRAEGVEISICLTDKYPNTAAFASVAEQMRGIRFERESVDATQVPARLTGFRTMFTSFHHFDPQQAKAILAAAARHRQGIAIFEGTARTALALILMSLVPLTVWLLTPKVRPFRWSRLFWTYLLPILPVAVLFDGFVSCLRTYTVQELLAMAQEVDGKGFEWEAGLERAPGCPFPVPYLIGVPRAAISDPSAVP
jgi:hypothetical protein